MKSIRVSSNDRVGKLVRSTLSAFDDGEVEVTWIGGKGTPHTMSTAAHEIITSDFSKYVELGDVQRSQGAKWVWRLRSTPATD